MKIKTDADTDSDLDFSVQHEATLYLRVEQTKNIFDEAKIK